MNKLFALIIFLAFSNGISAQIIKPIIYKRGKAAYVAHLQEKKKPNHKYDIKKFSSEFNHTIHLMNDSIVGANSDILRNAENGKYYLYFVDPNNALRKIYPEDTKFILHSNPYDADAEIVGYPTADRWLFTITEGKISAFAYSCTAKQMDFYSINNGDIKPFTDQQEIIDLLKNNKKAYALLLKNQYYEALEIYNKNGK